MGFFNTHPFLVTFVIGIILAMERSKQDVNSIQSTKLLPVRRWRDWRCKCLANATADFGGIGATRYCKAPFLAQSFLIVLFNVVHPGCVLVWRIMLPHGRGGDRTLTIAPARFSDRFAPVVKFSSVSQNMHRIHKRHICISAFRMLTFR